MNDWSLTQPSPEAGGGQCLGHSVETKFAGVFSRTVPWCWSRGVSSQEPEVSPIKERLSCFKGPIAFTLSSIFALQAGTCKNPQGIPVIPMRKLRLPEVIVLRFHLGRSYLCWKCGLGWGRGDHRWCDAMPLLSLLSVLVSSLVLLHPARPRPWAPALPSPPAGHAD